VSFNEQETRFHLIDPALRLKGYDDPQRIRLETPAPVEPTGSKGRRRKGPGRTDYLLCVQSGQMPKPLPVAVLEAKKESEDPLKGMQQAKSYSDCKRFDVHYVFATNGHLYGEYDLTTKLQDGPLPFLDFPPHSDLTARYAKDTGIDIAKPEAEILFQLDSPAWSKLATIRTRPSVRPLKRSFNAISAAKSPVFCFRWPPARAKPSSPPIFFGA
jgi:type I restriction enzyme R subunit